MSTIEFIQRFTEKRQPGKFRKPAVVVIEFGGGNCNKAGNLSCRDFCAVPNGKIYDSGLDPSLAMLADQFKTIAKLQPAILSIVPNGEALIVNQESNTSWGEIFIQQNQGNLSNKQVAVLSFYYSKRYERDSVVSDQAMAPAEKMAVCIAMAKKTGLNPSLTTNGSFLDDSLLNLYKELGLEFINLSYHPNKPFDSENCDLALEHLISRANSAIKIGIMPTITHVLTKQNADTFVALSDYVTEHDIFFGVGIVNARGGRFSTNNESIEPTKEQVKTVFRRLLARRLFADRQMRTTIPYLLMAPFLRNWVCDQSTDFFHLSIEKIEGSLKPKINVCSEIRSRDTTLEQFFTEDGLLDNVSYLRWREETMNDPEYGCNGCTHQCYFESETRRSLDIGMGVDMWDYYTTAGKVARLTRHPLRPTVSKRGDFQKVYLWESLLQGVAKVVASLKDSSYWQESFKRSGANYQLLLRECIDDVTNSEVINELIEREKKDEQIKMWSQLKRSSEKHNSVFSVSNEWHDAKYPQSRIFRAAYLPFQRSGREAGLIIPTLHFRGVLNHESPDDFRATIEDILTKKRKEKVDFYTGLLQFVKKISSRLSSIWNSISYLGGRSEATPGVFEVKA